jgi:hypothetical protein
MPLTVPGTFNPVEALPDGVKPDETSQMMALAIMKKLGRFSDPLAASSPAGGRSASAPSPTPPPVGSGGSTGAVPRIPFGETKI